MWSDVASVNIWIAHMCLIILILFVQAPTARQVKYKEKVQELRKKKDTGLSKEQKEKYMVWHGFVLLLLTQFCCSDAATILSLVLFPC